MRFSRPAPNNCSAGQLSIFGLSNFGDRRRVHHITAVHLHRIGIGRRDMAVPSNVFIRA